MNNTKRERLTKYARNTFTETELLIEGNKLKDLLDNPNLSAGDKADYQLRLDIIIELILNKGAN